MLRGPGGDQPLLHLCYNAYSVGHTQASIGRLMHGNKQNPR